MWCAAQSVQVYERVMDFQNALCWITVQVKWTHLCHLAAAKKKQFYKFVISECLITVFCLAPIDYSHFHGDITDTVLSLFYLKVTILGSEHAHEHMCVTLT